MSTSFDTLFRECLVCGSKFAIVLRYVGTARTKTEVPLVFCLHCHTSTCVSDYTEPECVLISGAEFNESFIERRRSEFGELCKFLLEQAQILGFMETTHADIGCGVGSLVNEMANLGRRIVRLRH